MPVNLPLTPTGRGGGINPNPPMGNNLNLLNAFIGGQKMSAQQKKTSPPPQKQPLTSPTYNPTFGDSSDDTGKQGPTNWGLDYDPVVDQIPHYDNDQQTQLDALNVANAKNYQPPTLPTYNPQTQQYYQPPTLPTDSPTFADETGRPGPNDAQAQYAAGGVTKKLPTAKQMGAMGMKKGGRVKETMGPRTMKEDVDRGSNRHLKHGESAVQKKGHTKGKNLGDSGKTVGIERGPKHFAKGGHVKSIDGIARRGHTKVKYR